MIVVPVKTQKYTFLKCFIWISYYQLLQSFKQYIRYVFYNLLFKSMPVEPKRRKWLYFKSDSMPLPNACRQK